MPAPLSLPSLQGHRLQLYGVFSTLMVSAVVASAFHKHSNFYSATVFLSRSSASVMVLANYGVLLTLLFGRLVQSIFFGRLSNAEVERLYDRTWYFLTESLLAFTIFRDEFDTPFVIMFGALLFLKCFHWLIADRIEWMDQQPYPGPNMLFHVRTNTLFFILWAIDVLMLDFAIESLLTHGVGGIVLFGSEYAILLASCLNSIMKYLVMVYDTRRARSRGGGDAPVWENKSMYMFYIELVTDFLKLTTYLIFFAIVMTFFGLPLNIIRDVYITGVSFFTRFRDLMRYRAATKNMETKYPDATAEELAAMSDHTCIICREEMTLPTVLIAHQHEQEEQQAPNGNINLLPRDDHPYTTGLNNKPKKLQCGHVFHFQCLRSWLERQQSCPTCRRSVLEDAETPALTPAQRRFVAELAEDAVAPRPANAGNNNAGAPGLPPPPPNNDAAQRQQLAAALINRLRGIPATRTPGSGSRTPATDVAPRAFQGFSVGGSWYAWDPTAAAAPPPAEESGETTPTAVPSGTSSVVPAPTPTAAAPIPSAVAPTPTPTNDAAPSTTTSETTITEERLSAREAAAAAALRRFGATSAPVAVAVQPVASSSAAAAAVAAVLPVETPTTAAPSASVSVPIPTPSLPSTSSAPKPTPTASTSNQPFIPTLIPLFDPSTVAQRPFLNLNLGSTPLMSPQMMYTQSQPQSALATPSLGATVSGSSFPFFTTTPGSRTPGTRTPGTRTPGTRTPARVRMPSLSSFADSPTSPLSRNPSSTSISSLLMEPPSGLTSTEVPTILTDELQLRRLDAWTREAIDERLKVLEDVQKSLWKAAEDLQRVRSSLPAEESESTEDVKGKGKARADDHPSHGSSSALGLANDLLATPMPDRLIIE